MEYSNSSLATQVVNFGNKNSNARNQYYADVKKTYNPTGVIDKIAIHHMAGKMTAKRCAEMHYKSSGSSANYYIGYEGEICLGVDESRRAWTTGDRECDSYAVTIEVSNDINKAPWTVSQKSYESLIKLVADICIRNKIKEPKFTGSKNGVLVMHRWYQSTSCPGDYLASKFADISAKASALMNGTILPEPKYTLEKFREDVRILLNASSNKEAFDKSITISTIWNKNNALVTPLERYMKALGYYTGVIEADKGQKPVYGGGMVKAVAQYQKDIVGSASRYCDGVLTKKAQTWNKLLLG